MATIGMVGVGGYGANILRGALAAENVRLAAISDTNPAAIEKAVAAAREAKRDTPRVVRSLDEMLRDDEIAGVVLVVPNPIHQQMAEAAFAAGRHVYVEKPIANRVVEALAMTAAAKRAGRTIMVGHNTRRAAGFRQAKRMLEAGELGHLVAMEANFSHSGGFATKETSWRWGRSTCPAVPLIQLGVHCIDTMHYFVGPARRVSAFMRSTFMPENEDTTVMLIEYASGILATLQSHYIIPGTNFIRLYGYNANLHVEWTHIEKTIRQPYGSRTLPVAEIDTQREEMEEFGRCIDENVRPETDGEGAVAALAVAEAAILSADRGGAPVTIDEVMDAAGAG